VKEICGTLPLPLPLLAGALGELALELEAGADAGAELELELLLLQAATSRAAETAAAVRPTLFPDTEYNGVPRLLSRHANRACARPDPYGPISVDRGASGGNAKTVTRNVPVNAFVKPLKKC
jgi:hypothetical protein